MIIESKATKMVRIILRNAMSAFFPDRISKMRATDASNIHGSKMILTKVIHLSVRFV